MVGTDTRISSRRNASEASEASGGLFGVARIGRRTHCAIDTPAAAGRLRQSGEGLCTTYSTAS